jgi:paraquat-inducible protein B
LAAFIGIVLSASWEKFFPNNDNLVVMYFDESVKGLTVGSSVVFKGVEVGRVSRIDLIADEEAVKFSIPVYVRFKPNQQLINVTRRYRYRKEALDSFIEKGLRARLATQSFLTGQLMIELDVVPDTPVVLRHVNDRNILEIPTVLSPTEKLAQGLQNLPIRTTVVRLNSILVKLDDSLPLILPKLEKMMDQLSAAVDENAPQTSDTMINLNQMLSDVSQAAKALRNFADYLERHPEALLKGKEGY